MSDVRIDALKSLRPRSARIALAIGSEFFVDLLQLDGVYVIEIRLRGMDIGETHTLRPDLDRRYQKTISIDRTCRIHLERNERRPGPKGLIACYSQSAAAQPIGIGCLDPLDEAAQRSGFLDKDNVGS